MAGPMSTHVLYRFFGADRELLYVGITINPGRRWRKHQEQKPWWTTVTSITLENHPSRAAVLEAECLAIQQEHPRFNVVHNRRTHPLIGEPIWPAESMPDDCHDHCVKAGILAMYYPYRWRGGKAAYACSRGHRWTCWWGHTQSGDAPANRGLDQLRIHCEVS